MAFTIKGQLDGLDALKATLANISQKKMRAAMRKGITKASRVVAAAAKAKIKTESKEKGHLEITGLLKRSISIKVAVNDKSTFGVIGPKKGMREQIGVRTRGGKKSKPGDPIYHDPAKIAHLVEYGHGGPHPAPPHPFMRPAWDANRRTAQQIIADELAAGIIKEVRS